LPVLTYVASPPSPPPSRNPPTHGVLSGLVSFGGAYSTLPFVYTDAVVSGGWLSTEQFLAALALTNVLPTPLVSFVGFIGYIGGNFPGPHPFAMVN